MRRLTDDEILEVVRPILEDQGFADIAVRAPATAPDMRAVVMTDLKIRDRCQLRLSQAEIHDRFFLAASVGRAREMVDQLPRPQL